MQKLSLVGHAFLLLLPKHIRGGPKKVSHYRESSLNRIKKSVNQARFFTNFGYKMSKKYYMFVLNTLCMI